MRTRSTPIRILNVIRFPIGGIRSYLRYTYSQFDPAGYEVTIVTVDRPEAALLQTGMLPLNVTLHTVRERHAILHLTRAVERLTRTGSFDIVHSQGATAALVAAPIARVRRLPHVVTLHETFRPEQFRGVAGWLKGGLIRAALRHADGVVAVSRDARENLLQHIGLEAGEATHLEVIPNGVAVGTVLDEAARFPHDIRRQFDIPAEVSLLGYVGRFMPEKGFDLLVEAVHRMARHGGVTPRFCVVAVNDGAFIREYKQHVRELGLESLFLFTGFQTSAAGTLAELDAVVIPSRREACPLVAMEAMILGCPVIASDCIGLRELTIGSPALQFRSGDASSLVSAIETFLSDVRGTKERASRYMPHARRTFDASRTADSLGAVFSRVRSDLARRSVAVHP